MLSKDNDMPDGQELSGIVHGAKALVTAARFQRRRGPADVHRSAVLDNHPDEGRADPGATVEAMERRVAELKQ